MATTKTSPAKRKTTTTKKTPTKRTPAKKTTAKRTPAKKPSTKRTSAKTVQSFKLQQSHEPFVSLKITIQTLYWLILAGAVLLLGLWVLDISQKVQAIYDEIDSNMVIQKELDERELQLLREKSNKDN